MKRYISEFTCSFALIFFGTGAIIASQYYGNVISGTGISMIFGVLIMVLVCIFGGISGCHMNPAVTLGFALMGDFPKRDILPYIFSQFSGAITASLLLKTMFPQNNTLGATLPSGNVFWVFAVEIALTLILMLVIIHSSRRGIIVAGIAIGATVMIEAMIAGSFSGASMNPIRSFAPALISGNLENVWIYLTAPVIGAMLGVPQLYRKRLHKQVEIEL
ncbi:MAG: aquaporin [Bacteroidota bacterium]